MSTGTEPFPTMIFARRSTPEPAEHESAQTHYSSQLAGEGLEREYEELVRAQLVRLGVPLENVEVEVRSAGTMQDGRKVYLAMVRLVKWEARTTLRLLIALPLLEAKTRQSLETTWLTDVSHFGGLWVHASSSLRDSEVMGDIREAIKLLELGAQAPDSMPAEAGWSTSVQAVLEVPPGAVKP
jgi:hypothetical protein